MRGLMSVLAPLPPPLKSSPVPWRPSQVYDFLIDELKTISQDKLGKQHVVFMMGGGDQRAGLCQRLAEEFGFQHIVAEQALKGAAAGGDTHAVAAALQTALKPLAEGAVVLLDGFPRNMKEVPLVAPRQLLSMWMSMLLRLLLRGAAGHCHYCCFLMWWGCCWRAVAGVPLLGLVLVLLSLQPVGDGGGVIVSETKPTSLGVRGRYFGTLDRKFRTPEKSAKTHRVGTL